MMRSRARIPIVPALWDSGAVGTNIVLSNGNRTASGSGIDTSAIVKATLPKSSGKLYWELAPSIFGALGQSVGFGFCTTATGLTGFIGATAGAYALLGPGDGLGEAALYNNGSQIQSSAYRFVDGNVLCFALDIDASKLWIRVNAGSWFGGGDPAVGTSPTWAVPAAGSYVIAGTPYEPGHSLTLNTHPSQLVHAAPSGFQAGWY